MVWSQLGKTGSLDVQSSLRPPTTIRSAAGPLIRKKRRMPALAGGHQGVASVLQSGVQYRQGLAFGPDRSHASVANLLRGAR